MHGDNRVSRDAEHYTSRPKRSAYGDHAASDHVKVPDESRDLKATNIVSTKKPKEKRKFSDDTTWHIARLLMYLFFITIVYIVASGTGNHERYFFSKVIYELFIDKEFVGYGGAITTFRRSSTINDFWGFTTIMNDGLYRSKWHWGSHSAVHLAKTSNLEGEMYDTKLVGRARLRQIRVKKTACPVQDYFSLLSRTCYPEYKQSLEESSPIITDKLKNQYEGWTYSTHKEFHASRFVGSLGVYSSAGYLIILDTNEVETRDNLLKPLRNDIWITRSSRAILLDFTFYNSNIDVFCVVRLAWEIPPTGGVSTSWDIQTIQYITYETRYKKFVFACQIIFVLFTFLYFLEEIYHLGARGWRVHFKHVWTYVGILIFAFSIFAIQHTIQRYFHLSEVLKKDISSNSKEDVSIFQELAFWENIFNCAVSAGIGLMWIALLKYLAFIPAMAQLFGTMTRCAKDIGGFGIIFLIVFMSFAQLGHLVFGNQVLAFSSLGRSISTLVAFMLGDFDYQAVVDANRLIGPLFFVAFVVFVFMILVNMFLAIVNVSYHTVIEEKVPFQEPRSSSNTSKCCKCCKPKAKHEKVSATKIVINPSDINLELLRHEFSEVEIAMFFNRFEIHDSEFLDVDQSHKLLSDVTSNKYVTKDDSAMTYKRKSLQAVSLPSPPNLDLERAEHFNMLNRLGAIESAVLEIVPKVDSIMENIELLIMKKLKAKRLQH